MNNLLYKFVIKFDTIQNANDESVNSNYFITGQKTHLSIEYSNVEPDPTVFEKKDFFICILGNPMLDDNIDPISVAQFIYENRFDLSKMIKLNGEFLIIVFDKEKDSIEIITDRFSSHPIYYYKLEDGIIASYSYNDLFLKIRDKSNFEYNDLGLFEMLYFRRLLFDKTLDKSSKYLMPAHILLYKDNKINLTKYWERNYTKTKNTLEESAIELVSHIKKSIQRKTSDNKKNGLFLSGGLDTRTVLAAFSVPPVCFTATYNVENNREFNSAKQLATLVNAEHSYLKIPKNHFTNIINSAVKQIGGMHQANSIFMGFRTEVQEKANVVFHGHGFDYMFQGMYLPTDRFQLPKLPLFYKKLTRIQNKSVVDFFIKNCPYRIKYPWVEEFVNNTHQQKFLSKNFKNLFINFFCN